MPRALLASSAILIGLLNFSRGYIINCLLNITKFYLEIFAVLVGHFVSCFNRLRIVTNLKIYMKVTHTHTHTHIFVYLLVQFDVKYILQNGSWPFRLLA